MSSAMTNTMLGRTGAVLAVLAQPDHVSAAAEPRCLRKSRLSISRMLLGDMVRGFAAGEQRNLLLPDTRDSTVPRLPCPSAVCPAILPALHTPARLKRPGRRRRDWPRKSRSAPFDVLLCSPNQPAIDRLSKAVPTRIRRPADNAKTAMYVPLSSMGFILPRQAIQSIRHLPARPLFGALTGRCG